MRKRSTISNHAGFTLIEILVVLVILAIIVVVITAGVIEYAAHQAFKTTVADVRDGVIEMRQRTLASSDDMLYGVHVSSTEVTLFEGAAYTAGAPGNTVIPLPGSTVATTSFSGDVTSATFTRITGVPSATGTIVFTDLSSESSATITISGSGHIE